MPFKVVRIKACYWLEPLIMGILWRRVKRYLFPSLFIMANIMKQYLFLLSTKLASHLNWRAVQWLGWFIGQLFIWLPNQEKRAARVNIGLCFPELSSQEQEKLLKQSMIESAITMVEMPGAWCGNSDSLLSRLDDPDGQSALNSLIEQGRGVIIAGPHLGSWEICGLFLARIAPITTLYRPPRYDALAKLMTQGRSRTGARLVPTDASGVKALYKTLRQGGMVAILPDQQPKSTRGAVFAPFFGQPALTMELISRLSAKTGAPVIFSFVERLPRGKGYRVHWVQAPEGINDTDAVVAATALNQGVENCIRICPTQYQWSYKRFRKHPDGKTNRYAASK